MRKQKLSFVEYEEIHEDYTTQQKNCNLSIPANFRMLCALFETSPEKILSDFMWNVSFMVSKGTDETRNAALKYFLVCGYGQNIYSEQEIRQIFQELDAKRLLWPDRDEKMISKKQRELHYMWSNMYVQFWFEKWYRKNRREKEENPLLKY